MVAAPFSVQRRMINIELKLLATMLYRGDFSPILNDQVTATDFTTDSGKTLFEFIKNYRYSGKKNKFPSLSVVRSRFDSVTLDLPEPDPADKVEQLVEEVHLRRRRSRIAEIATELEDIAQDPADPFESLSSVFGRLRRMIAKDDTARVLTLADSIDKIRNDYLSGELMPEGRKWVWPTLHKATRGIHAKELYLLVGRPKSKKTFLALVQAVFDVMNGGRVLVFTPEMRAEQILVRAVAIAAAVVYHEFKDATLDEAQTRRLLQLADTFARRDAETDKQYRLRLRSTLNLPKGAKPSLVIVESAGRNLSWMEAQVELHEPTLVVADSVYRQSPDQDKGNDAGWKAFTSVMRGTKNMSMRTGVPFLATHQINRAGQNNVGGLENLALGDAAGQETDLALRAISGTIDGKPMTALIPLGGREIEVDQGILINSMLCTDFTEVGTVIDRKVIKQLMKRELDEEDEDEGVKKSAKKPSEREASKTAELRRKNVKKAGARVDKSLEDVEIE